METFSKDWVLPFDLKGRTVNNFMRAIAYYIPGPVYLRKDDREVNLDSLLGVLSLGGKKGDEVTIKTYDQAALDKFFEIVRMEEF